MKKTALAAVIILLLGAAVYLSTYTVSAREVAIVTQFGKVMRTIDTPGLYLKLPGRIHKVNRFDSRLNVFETQNIQLLLADKNPIIVSCYVAWKIGNPIIFFQSLTRVDNATSKLNDMIVSDLGGILGEYKIDNIINTDTSQIKLTEIETRLLANANGRGKRKYGIDFVQIGVRRIAYPAVVSEAVYTRMSSERAKEAEKLRAEGKKEAARIESDAEREVKEILAQAYKESQIIKGEGDKEAMRIYAESYGKDPEFFDFLRSLEAYQQILSNKSTLILSTESELFKHLNPKRDAKAK